MAKAPLVHDLYTPDTGVVRPSTMAAGASIGAVRIRQISNPDRAEWMRYSSAVRRKLDWRAPAPPERHPASRRVAENRERLDPRPSRRYSRRASCAWFQPSLRLNQLAPTPPDLRHETARYSAPAPAAMTPQAVLPTLAEASQAAETIENPSSRIAVLASISGLLHRAGDVSTAATSLSVALAIARTIPEDSARASALADIAETQAAIDAPDAARKTIAEALAVVPKAGGGKERTSALSAIAKAQAATGDIAAARATGGRVHELDVRDRVLLDIADHAESVGKYWEALSALRAIVDCDNRAHSLASVARAQGKGGDLPGATRSCAEALTATRGLEDEVERVPDACSHLRGFITQTAILQAQHARWPRRFRFPKRSMTTNHASMLLPFSPGTTGNSPILRAFRT